MGLVQYDSSDEDEDLQEVTERSSTPPVKPPVTEIQQAAAPPPVTSHTPPQPDQKPSTSTPNSTDIARPADPAQEERPVLGPAGPPPSHQAGDHQQLGQDQQEVDLSFLGPSPSTQPTTTDPPRSPYTTTRTLLRDLTLPAVPDMDIPPSPPPSPSDGDDRIRDARAALTAKCENFLRLKRQDVHFNARLAGASGMRNPAMMGKLLGFVGVGTEFGGEGEGDGDDGDGDGGRQMRGTEQYATVLSAEVWDPHGFPAWAYRGGLRKAQERMARGKGEPVEFVAAGAAGGGTGGGSKAGSAGGSRAGTPGVGGVKRKGRFDA